MSAQRGSRDYDERDVTEEGTEPLTDGSREDKQP